MGVFVWEICMFHRSMEVVPWVYSPYIHSTQLAQGNSIVSALHEKFPNAFLELPLNSYNLWS